MGALRTSEEGGDVLGGEAKQAKSDDNRSIDAPGRIIIDSHPFAAAHPAPRPLSQPTVVPPTRQGGLGLVIVVYVLATAALAAAIYERFFT